VHWICARLDARRERVAEHFLRLAGFEIYIPLIRETRIRRRRPVELLLPLFPCYCFVAVEGQWRAARWSIGVSAIVMNGVSPARVPDNVIAAIRAREVRGAVELPKTLGLRVGDQVRISSGPFEGHLGLYSGMRPHERCEVLLQLLGSRQRVELPRAAISAAQ
jgi:transcription antitermination factor NusG